TSTGDFPQPPTSYLVQHALGAFNAACFDVNVVCSGFVYALTLAHSLIAQRPTARALVIGADVYSRILDFTDRRTAILFADGAGAAVVAAVPEPYGIIASDLSSRGDAHHLIRVEAGGSRNPASAQTLA
ncbi:3-oxoacyl-ACP synthase III family protein, partial [Streptomyces sp. NPDC127574]